MRKYLLFILIIGFVACNSTDQNTVEDATTTNESNKPPATSDPIPETTQVPEKENIDDLSTLVGYYVGDFVAKDYNPNKDYTSFNRINIAIDSFQGDQIYGHSVVAGNNRPFTGSFSIDKDVIKVEASEPGDDRYDGKFYFQLLPKTKQIKGTWEANNKKLAVSTREYELDHKKFNYNPNLDLPNISWTDLYQKYDEFNYGAEFLTEEVVKFNPSKVLLKKEDVENMYKGDLEVMRNSIYARHGYSFKNRRIRFIFDQMVNWYIPVSTDVRGKFSEIEKKNIELMKRYEKHAEVYYDEFGR